MTKRKEIGLLAVLIMLVLCFIWGNSMLSGESSGAMSSGLRELIVEAFPFLNWIPEIMLRKMGHFSEFGLLGFLLAWFFLNQGQRGFHRFTMPLLCSMTAALIDETIQTFSLGRGPSVTDVWIDVSGAVFGIAMLYALRALYYLLFKRKGCKK